MTVPVPTPPVDPALPGLATMLDGEAVARLLATTLPDCADGAVAIEGCQPVYVRYKPATGCLVAYNLSFRDRASSEQHTTTGYLRIYAGDRALERWGSRSLARLVDRADRLQPSPPIARTAYLPGVAGLALLYPIDLGLRTLVRATTPQVVRQSLAASIPGTASLPSDEPPATIRYKPERKALLRYPLHGDEGGSIYGKLHDDGRGPLLVETGRALLGAGVRTADPIGYLPDLRLLLHAEAPGRPLSDVLHHNPDEVLRWMDPLAAVLTRLHGAVCPWLPTYGVTEEGEAVQATARMIGAVLPDLAARAERAANAINERLADVPDRWVTSHGDFYHDQALVDGDGAVTLIDLDEARIAHPLLDVGNFLAHFRVATIPGEAVERAAAAFRDAYRRIALDDLSALPVFEAAGLLRLAIGPFRRLEPDWPDGVERRLNLAETVLAEHRPGRQFAPYQPAGSPAPADPALPQLRPLTDRSVMSSTLARAVFAAPVDVQRIEVVRHKPGRRAILRFDLAVGPPALPRSLRLYGKTFASERGPRVYEITRRIVAARAFGPDVALPEPVAYLTDHKLLLQREASGSPLASALLAGDTDLAERVADAICAFHASGIDLGRTHDLAKELDPLRDRIARFAADYPPLAMSAQTCLSLVEKRRQSGWMWRWRPIHRDFYHDQLLVTAGCPTSLAVLDLDDAAMAEPAVDIANFAAHLRLLALQACADPDRLAPIAAAFLQGCRDLDHNLDPLLVCFLEGATLLRLATIHAPRRDGARIALALLSLGERLLSTISQPASIGAGRAA